MMTVKVVNVMMVLVDYEQVEVNLKPLGRIK